MKIETLLEPINLQGTWAYVPDNWIKKIHPGIINLYLMHTNKYPLPTIPDTPTLSKAYYLGRKTVEYRGQQHMLADIAEVLKLSIFKELVYKPNTNLFKLTQSTVEWERMLNTYG